MKLPNRSPVGWWRAAVAGALIAFGPARAEDMDETKLPPAAATTVDFARDIQPLFEKSCYRCHGPERPKSRFRLDDRQAALKGGEHGVDIVPGQSAKSPLIYYVARLVEDMEMPPSGKGEPLTSPEVSLLRAWIDQGAKWPAAESVKAKTLFSIEPSFAWIGVSGNRNEFREQTGLNDGWSGGVQEFLLEERTRDGVKLNVEGRALANQEDYRVKVKLEKPDFGFFNFGFEQFRKYYDDTGGYYERFGSKAVSLDRDLYQDIGHAWFDVGLTLPNWPRVVLGYEYQFKDGSKSSLAWSDIRTAVPFPGSYPKAIFPSYKDIQEQTHIVKLDASYEISGLRLEESFRGEFYNLDNDRYEYFSTRAGTPPSGLTRYHEDYSHFQAVNTFRGEKQIKDWLLVGGGYLYSKLDGDGGFSAESFRLPSAIPQIPLIDWGNPIVIERETHIGNLNSLWGPWDGLTLSAGLQNEWTHEMGFGQGLVQMVDPDLPGMQHVYSSERDKVVLEEDVGLRYTKIPFTVLFADARFRQEWIDLSESDQNTTEQADYLLSNDAELDLRDFRTGFTLSPWTRVSLDASYKHRLSKTDYDNKLDPAFSNIAGNGYPGFFSRREIESDEVEVRLVLHPARWLKTTLKYQLVASDYHTTTNTILETGEAISGSGIHAGNYDAQVYSINATLTPWRRLNLSSTFSYSDARTVSGVNGLAGTTPYKGDIYSVLSSANFIVSESTDWNVSYIFGRADYSQSNNGASIPLGIDYTRHGVMTGVTRRFNKKTSASLQYGFFRYDDPSSGGSNDYIAHAVFASLKMVFD